MRLLCVDDEALILTSLREQLRRRFGSRSSYLLRLSWRRYRGLNRRWGNFCLRFGFRCGSTFRRALLQGGQLFVF